MEIKDRDYFQEDRKTRLEKNKKSYYYNPKDFRSVKKTPDQQPQDLDAVLKSWIPIHYGLAAFITFSTTIYIVSVWPTSLVWAYKIALRFHYLLESLFFL